MKYWLILLPFVAGVASAETVFVCKGPDPMQPACGSTCVVQAWDKAHGPCTEAMDTTDAAFISYRDRVPTQAMIDQDFEDSLLESEVFRALVKTIRELHGPDPAVSGVTLPALIQKLKDNR